jgi:muramoyltetrapeptide carboxypeptidase
MSALRRKPTFGRGRHKAGASGLFRAGAAATPGCILLRDHQGDPAMKVTVSGNVIPKVRRLRILAPASRPTEDMVAAAQAAIEEVGVAVSVDMRAFEDAGWTAGTDAVRLASLNDALEDETIDAILCARGGFGSPKIADKIAKPRGPKVVIGYSDITFLLWRLFGFDHVKPVHAAVASEFIRPEKTDTTGLLLRLLAGEDLSEHLAQTFQAQAAPIRGGAFSAPLIGGNLSTLQTAAGTPVLEAGIGHALFLEDTPERMYVLDRMLNHLERVGVFGQSAALLFGDIPVKSDDGGFTEQSLQDVFSAIAERAGKPALAGFPVGHGGQNVPVVFGAQITVA